MKHQIAAPPTAPHLLGWLDNKRLDKVEAYARDGRRYRDRDSAALKDEWVVAFRNWTQHLTNRAARATHEAIQAELSLRGEEPPYDRVQADIDHFLAQVKQRMQDLPPDMRGKMNAALTKNLNDFYKDAAASLN